MLDIKFIRENKELVKKACTQKNFPVDIDKLLALDQEIRPLKQELEGLQAQRNSLSKELPKLKGEEQKQTIERVKKIKDEMELLSDRLREKNADLHTLMLLVPQPAREDVPVGKDDQFNVEVFKWGTPREFSFPFKDHVTLGDKLGILDMERGVKISGSRSYILTGDGALLEQALMRFSYDLLLKRGFKPMSVPVLVKDEAMEGTGYFPLGREQAYCVEKDQMALVGTSEVALCSIHAEETIAEENLPIRYMAWTPCFRREAGSYGRDTRGLYRVHQFQKIEMVIFHKADQDETNQLHEELVRNAEDIVQALGLPYRKVYVCSGDLGQGQVRKHDIETWMPSRGAYGETHSCSSFYDFQARRLGIKYKGKDGDRKFVYTLNNTACAAPRLLLAIIENYQTEDGRLEVPACLRPYMGGKEYIG